jgi:hypothetical protein
VEVHGLRAAASSLCVDVFAYRPVGSGWHRCASDGTSAGSPLMVDWGDPRIPRETQLHDPTRQTHDGTSRLPDGTSQTPAGANGIVWRDKPARYPVRPATDPDRPARFKKQPSYLLEPIGQLRRQASAPAERPILRTRQPEHLPAQISAGSSQASHHPRRTSILRDPMEQIPGATQLATESSQAGDRTTQTHAGAKGTPDQTDRSDSRDSPATPRDKPAT